MGKSSKLNLVCIDDCDHAQNAFDWYINNHHHPNDIIGFVYVHLMPVFPTIGVMGGGAAFKDEYHIEMSRSMRTAEGRDQRSI